MLPELACIFSGAPIVECGLLIAKPAQTLADSWPLMLVFAPILGLCGYAYLCSIYRHEIDWNQEPEKPKPLPSVETVARDAGA
ncbi:hypothetical protein [Bosea eneae]